MLKRFWNDERGQGMTEYILIVALIAIIAVVGIRFFGDKISSLFNKAADKVQNESGIK